METKTKEYYSCYECGTCPHHHISTMQKYNYSSFVRRKYNKYSTININQTCKLSKLSWVSKVFIDVDF